MSRQPHAAPAGEIPSPPITPPPPKRLYNVVDPAALARVYAGAYGASRAAQTHSGIAESDARSAVRDFVRLMREEVD